MRTASVLIALSCLASASAIASNEIRVSAPIRGTSSWLDIAAQTSDWLNVGGASNCSSISPDAGSFSSGISFTQTLSGCTQTQSRTVSQRAQNSSTGEIRVVSTTTEERIIADYSYTAQAVGSNPQVCKYESSPQFSWVEGGEKQTDESYYGTSLTWNGETFGQTIYSGPINTPIDHLDRNGYRYTRGNYRESETLNEVRKLFYFRYSICRQPL